MPPVGHSRVGASSAYRWMACPGSVRLSVGMPNESSVYAEEGTAAHELAEKCLLEEREAAEFIGQAIYKDYVVDDEMAGHVQLYCDIVTEQMAESGEGALLRVEEPFHLEWLHKDLYGTNDACVIEPYGTIHVFDLKYGQGVAVEAENNSQLLYYALGAAEIVGRLFTKVVVHIVQPRCDHPEGVHRTWEVGYKDLYEFADKLREAVEATEQENPPLVTGSHCRFCNAKPVCPKVKQELMEVSKAEVKDDGQIVLPAPQDLTSEELKAALDMSGLFNTWVADIFKYALAKAREGQEVEGYKLVEKQTRRGWKDEDKAVETLKTILPEEDVYTKKVLTMPQAEKVLQKRLGDKKEVEKALAGLWEKPKGDLTLAPITDKRTAKTGKSTQQLANEYFKRKEG